MLESEQGGVDRMASRPHNEDDDPDDEQLPSAPDTAIDSNVNGYGTFSWSVALPSVPADKDSLADISKIRQFRSVTRDCAFLVAPVHSEKFYGPESYVRSAWVEVHFCLVVNVMHPDSLRWRRTALAPQKFTCGMGHHPRLDFKLPDSGRLNLGASFLRYVGDLDNRQCEL